jgi:hypothetical protein
MARPAKTNMVRRPDLVCLPLFRAWQKAIGMPTWRVMAATDLSDSTICKAEHGKPVSMAVARLLAIALEVPLDLFLSVSPDHEEAREIVRLRAAEVQKELAAHNAALDARRLAFLRTLPAEAA